MSAEDLQHEYSPGSVLRFTKQLIIEKDYYRASQELHRLKVYYPDALTTSAFNATQNYLLYKANQFDTLIKKNDVAGLSGYINLLYKCDAYFKKNNVLAADKTISFYFNHFSNNPDPFFMKRYLLACVFQEKPIDTTRISADFGIKYKELVSYKNNAYNELKNPMAALSLGLIPGGGYIYSGNKSTGIVTMFVLAINIAVSYFAFKTGNEAIGYVTGTIGILFYTGSIVGGYLETKKYNDSLIRNTREYLAGELHLDDDHLDLLHKYGIGGK